MIVVTGATGNVGRPLVRALVEAGEEVTAVSRRDGDVPPGVRHVRADLADPQSLGPALDGADALFLLTPGDFHAHGDLDKIVAMAGGVRRVVLLSSVGVGTGRHRPVFEEAVSRSQREWTILRPGGFASNALQWAEQVRTTRTVAAPFADVAIPLIDPDDIAAVAAVVLRENGHGGRIYELSGPAPISPREQAAAIGAALGEPVRFVELTREQARAQLLRFMPEPVADATLDALGSPLPAELGTGADLRQLLGRPARPFLEWARRNVAAFR
ncbi:SDR family oxidoreductase [Actinophytocola sp.]|uniref:SDR family oxidoreductase n=1 Tax=Actinophytocola sp. TaxID=1872138 RepID=UPI00389B18ED